MNKIEIKIQGLAGVGKSTIATFIADKLMKAGFENVELDLIDVFDDEWFSKNNRRMKSICDNKITITEEWSK